MTAHRNFFRVQDSNYTAPFGFAKSLEPSQPAGHLSFSSVSQCPVDVTEAPGQAFAAPCKLCTPKKVPKATCLLLTASVCLSHLNFA